MGEEAVEEVRAKVRAFITDGRNDIDEREKFNQWFHSTGLVVLVDPQTKRIEIGPAKIKENRLVEFWDSEWILEQLEGEDRERYLADVARIKL